MSNYEIDPFMPEGGAAEEQKGESKLEQLGALTVEALEAIKSNVRENHERWIEQAKAEIKEKGLVGVMSVSAIASYIGLGGALSSAAHGKFEESLSYVGVIGLSQLAKKIAELVAKSKLPEDSELRQAIERQDVNEGMAKFRNLYRQSPDKAKGFIKDAEAHLENEEGGDYKEVDRKKRIEAVIEEKNGIYGFAKDADDVISSQDVHYVTETMHRGDPELRRRFLDRLAASLSYRTKRNEIDELERQFGNS